MIFSYSLNSIISTPHHPQWGAKKHITLCSPFFVDVEIGHPVSFCIDILASCVGYTRGFLNGLAVWYLCFTYENLSWSSTVFLIWMLKDHRDGILSVLLCPAPSPRLTCYIVGLSGPRCADDSIEWDTTSVMLLNVDNRASYRAAMKSIVHLWSLNPPETRC